jgi:hypothetical protein
MRGGKVSPPKGTRYALLKRKTPQSPGGCIFHATALAIGEYIVT